MCSTLIRADLVGVTDFTIFFCTTLRNDSVDTIKSKASTGVAIGFYELINRAEGSASEKRMLRKL